MKLAIFGASGGVGRELVAQALKSGHQVRAVYRSQPTEPKSEIVIVPDLNDVAALKRAVAGTDVVLCSVGLRRENPKNPWSKLISPPDLNERFTKALIAAMADGPRRLVIVSAAGVAESRSRLSPVLKFLFDQSKVGIAYQDLGRAEALLRSSGLDWLAVRPTTLTDGPFTGQARTAEYFGLSSTISRADVAAYMLRAITAPTPQDRLPFITTR